MSLDDFFHRASWLANVAKRAQYICRDNHGNLYVTDDPPFLESVVMKAIPDHVKAWPMAK